MEEEEVNLKDAVKKKISKEIISKNTKEQTIVIKAEVCDHRLKLLILNILIFIVCILIIYKLISLKNFHKTKNFSFFLILLFLMISLVQHQLVTKNQIFIFFFNPFFFWIFTF